jgi:EAL domain-containing protein (putative c-di-GMP-specific phosphodiesterase class I)
MKRKFDKFFKVVVMVLLTIIALKDFGCNHKKPEVTKYCPKDVVKCSPRFTQ